MAPRPLTISWVNRCDSLPMTSPYSLTFSVLAGVCIFPVVSWFCGWASFNFSLNPGLCIVESRALWLLSKNHLARTLDPAETDRLRRFPLKTHKWDNASQFSEGSWCYIPELWCIFSRKSNCIFWLCWCLKVCFQVCFQVLQFQSWGEVSRRALRGLYFPAAVSDLLWYKNNHLV